MIDGCLQTLYKILEDIPALLDPIQNSPLPILIPKWLNFLKSENIQFCKLSLLSLELLLEQSNPHLENHITEYLTSLSNLSNNSNSSILALVCNSINELLFYFPNNIVQYIPQLIPYMFEMLKNEDVIVKIRATEFFDNFTQVCGEIGVTEILIPFFNKLIPILLQV